MSWIWISRLVQPSRQGKRFVSFFVQKRETFLYFCLIGLLVFQSFIDQAHSDFEGSIMPYSSKIAISARLVSGLCGVIRLAPSQWGTRPSSSSISCSTKLQQPINALCFENTSAFQFKTARNDSKSLAPFFALSVLFLVKPVCQILVQMMRGVGAARQAVVRFGFY